MGARGPVRLSELRPGIGQRPRFGQIPDTLPWLSKFDGRFDVVHQEVERRVTGDEFHDAMLALNKSLERTHARVVDADMRAFTVQRETQILLGQIQEYLDARHGLEDRVTRCGDDLADLKRRVL